MLSNMDPMSWHHSILYFMVFLSQFTRAEKNDLCPLGVDFPIKVTLGHDHMYSKSLLCQEFRMPIGGITLN